MSAAPRERKSEGLIQDEIRLVLGAEPSAVFWRNNLSTVMMPNGSYVKLGVGGKGATDLIGVFRGRACFLEIKTDVGRLSPEQVRFGELVKAKGAEHAVLRSADEARQWLDDMRRRFPA